MIASNQRESLTGAAPPLKARGFLWSVAAPAGWLLFAYAYEVHARLTLGRWPDYNEMFYGWPLFAHYTVAEWLAHALFYSLYAVPFVLAGCLCNRRWRDVSMYLLCYGAAVGIAFGAVLLTRYDLLSWITD